MLRYRLLGYLFALFSLPLAVFGQWHDVAFFPATVDVMQYRSNGQLNVHLAFPFDTVQVDGTSGTVSLRINGYYGDRPGYYVSPNSGWYLQRRIITASGAGDWGGVSSSGGMRITSAPIGSYVQYRINSSNGPPTGAFLGVWVGADEYFDETDKDSIDEDYLVESPSSYSVERTENISNTSYEAGEIYIVDSSDEVIGVQSVPPRFSGGIDLVVPEGATLHYRAPDAEIGLKKETTIDGDRWVWDVSSLPTVSSTTIGTAEEGKISYDAGHTVEVDEDGNVWLRGRRQMAIDTGEGEKTVIPTPRHEVDDKDDIDELSLARLESIEESLENQEETLREIADGMTNEEGESYAERMDEAIIQNRDQAASTDWESMTSGLVDDAESGMSGLMPSMSSVGSVSSGAPSVSGLLVTIPGYGEINFDLIAMMPSWLTTSFMWTREVILWALVIWFFHRFADELNVAWISLQITIATPPSTGIENAAPGVAQVKRVTVETVVLGVISGIVALSLVMVDSHAGDLLASAGGGGGGGIGSASLAAIRNVSFSVPAPMQYGWNLINLALPMTAIVLAVAYELGLKVALMGITLVARGIIRMTGAI